MRTWVYTQGEREVLKKVFTLDHIAKPICLKPRRSFMIVIMIFVIACVAVVSFPFPGGDRTKRAKKWASEGVRLG